MVCGPNTGMFRLYYQRLLGLGDTDDDPLPDADILAEAQLELSRLLLQIKA